MNRNESWSIGISRARDLEISIGLFKEIQKELLGTMNRNESLQLQLATLIQEGHTSKATAYETAGRVLELLNAEEDAERVNLNWPRFAVLPEKLPMASDLLRQ